MDPVRIVCLSDTHDRHDELDIPEGDIPEGDILLHAGDATSRGRVGEVEAFGAFLARMPHPHKVVIAGNHDFLFQEEPRRARELLGDVDYLLDGEVTVCGLRIWGAPWQPWFHDWAFNLARGAEIAEKWALVPDGVDVLLTHGPPMGILDRTSRGERVGCEELARALGRIQPRLHVFGHIHEEYGTKTENGTLFVNACNCNLRYQAVQAPIVVDWTSEGPRLVD